VTRRELQPEGKLKHWFSNSVREADSAGGQKPSLPPQISKRARMDLIRGFNAELVYVRSPFPMGKRGLVLKNGKLSPGGEELQRMLAISGPAVKPGDQARISQIVIKDDRIRFEINGGPVKKQKWYQHISWEATGAPVLLRPVLPLPTRAAPMLI
jgi:hypothetical protein